MQIQAAVVEETSGPFVVRDVELDDPRPYELRVRVVAGQGQVRSRHPLPNAWPDIGEQPPGGILVLRTPEGGHEEHVRRALEVAAAGGHNVLSF